MAIDWDKPLRTRDGRNARLIATIDAPDYKRVVVVTRHDGSEKVDQYAECGRWLVGDINDDDLFNGPEVTYLYSNVWPATHEMGMWRDHDTKSSNGGARGFVKVTLEDGKPVAVELY